MNKKKLSVTSKESVSAEEMKNIKASDQRTIYTHSIQCDVLETKPDGSTSVSSGTGKTLTCETECDGNWETQYAWDGPTRFISGLRCDDKIEYCDGTSGSDLRYCCVSGAVEPGSGPVGTNSLDACKDLNVGVKCSWDDGHTTHHGECSYNRDHDLECR